MATQGPAALAEESAEKGDHCAAAEPGEAEAMYPLGCAYYHGTGVAQDREVAATWFREAVLTQRNHLAGCCEH